MTDTEVTAEKMAADHAALWKMMGGEGDPPPVIVSPQLHRKAIAASYPAEKMIVANDVPPGEARIESRR